ncbi:MAG: hypothetical protein LBE92_15045 [Chryseobacterium sp.]|uniref:tetratricopeptide repeat-containing sensor histidine kinase n=1 Tax=Chryseobacterium sp. TaxID=1871047 RepID=UPI002824688D|nr:ATP-binding protein [Chryseobacterium sp.]MDR2237436.1 hypothetical protein [Chryseobacterium sp.]
MAIIQTHYGDFYGSIETSLEANHFLKNENDSITKRDLAASYNNMGIASAFLYNYDNAVAFYKNAIKYSNNNKYRYIYYNNLSDALLSQRNPKMAQKYLEYAIQDKDYKNKSRALNNLARAKQINDKSYNPLPEFYHALEIREKNNDLEGLNSSYATLANFFFEKDKNKSLEFANKMLKTSIEIRNPEDQLQALQKIINLDKNNYQKYFKRFQEINDSTQIARNNAKNQFAYFRYGIEKEKTKNQTLMAEQIKNENHILKQYFLSAALVLIIIITVLSYRKRQIRLKKEKELEVKNTELKMSKKVHDVVANGIYQVMTKIENQESFDKEKALDELEFVYEKSRDLSYEKLDQINSEKDFKEKISSLIASFKNDETETYTVGNEHEVWSGISPSDFEELYQIIRELLVNMKKHSQATRVIFKFERTGNLVQIQYTDNGIGISGDLIHKNGLTNTVSRIDTIKGAIIFDNKTEKGLKINISFPAS